MKTKLLLLNLFAFLLFVKGQAQAPSITGFLPMSGSIGSLVTISGTNLSNPTSISIGGVNAIKISASANSITALVMPAAVSGAVSVTTAAGTSSATGNFTLSPSMVPNTQQGNKLVGTGNTGNAYQGRSVSLSADGNTAIVGGFSDNNYQGAAWVYSRSGNTWTQQGNKLVGTGNVGYAWQGVSVSISADGNTVIVGGFSDNDWQGAAWIYTRSGNTWIQQGNKLVGTGSVGQAYQGRSVSLSADGNTAIVGGANDNTGQGAAWVFTRSGNTWTQQGNKLVGAGSVGSSYQGISVSLSADGNTAIVGGLFDNNNQGAAWIYTRSGNTWTQQGNKLVGTGSVGSANQGASVSLSADGKTAIVGGHGDNNWQGAAWTYTRSGNTWSQQGNELVGTGNVGYAWQGVSVSISADGNTAIVGGANDNTGQGAAWVFVSPSSNANLSNLSLNQGALSPSFNMDSINYLASVSNATTSITLNPTKIDSNASMQVRVNGGAYSTLNNGAISSSLSLNVGNNIINIKVTAQDGITTKIYTITVNRALSSNADLASLDLSQADLSPNYKNNTFAYNTVVSNSTNSITVTAVPSNSFSTIQVRVNGGTYTNLSNGIASSALNLNIGSNTIDVRVTAQDGITVKTYSVNITRVGIVSSLNLSVKAYLQGLYNGHGSMISALNKANGSLPINIADTIILELINPTDNSLAYSILRLNRHY
jgi:hypothetical protein